MNLFNILCINDKSSVTDHLRIIFLFLGSLLLFYGITNVCKNVIDCKKDSKAKKKCKIGLFSIFISIVMIATTVLLNLDFFLEPDPCNSDGPIISVLSGILNLIQIFVPVYYLIRSIVSIIKMLKCKGPEKKEQRKKIIKYLITALMIFIAATILDLLLGLVNVNDRWAECWCNE